MRNPLSRNALRDFGRQCSAFVVGLGLIAVNAPAIAQGGLVPRPVESTALARDVFATGTLSRDQGALPGDLWKGAGAATLEKLLDAAPTRPSGAALGDALRRTLLSSGEAPAGAGASLGGKKLVALVRAGYADSARTIASLSNAGSNDASLAEALALADLLDGDFDKACQRNAALPTGRDAPFWVRLRVVCYAQRGEREAAELTLSLLREQGALGDVDEILFSALTTGAAPKAPPPIRDAFHLTAWRMLKLPLAPALLRDADGGVLKAVAADTAYDPSTRAAAGVLAADMGVASRAELLELYKSLPSPVAPSGAKKPVDDPFADVLAWRALQAMTDPAQLRDRATLTAEAIGAAKSRRALRAAALAYAGDIENFEGVLLTPSDYAHFALARLAIGDSPGAAKWLAAMRPDSNAAPLSEPDMMEFIEIVSLLSILDPARGKAVADKAGVETRDVLEDAPAGLGPVAPALPGLVEAAFDAAVKGSKGQAALAALATAATVGPEDAVGRVVVAQSLRAAGLETIRNRMLLDQALALRYAGARIISPRPQDAPGLVRASTQQPATAPTPRAKPRAAAAPARPVAKPAVRPPAKPGSKPGSKPETPAAAPRP